MPENRAELVVKNARVYTMNASRGWASEFAVKGGRVIAVGEAGVAEGCAAPADIFEKRFAVRTA